MISQLNGSMTTRLARDAGAGADVAAARADRHGDRACSRCSTRWRCAASADARSMASGVSQAMICTMTGLAVSITGLYPVHYFKDASNARNRVARRQVELLITCGSAKRRSAARRPRELDRHRPRADARLRDQPADLLHHHRRVRQGVGPHREPSDELRDASREPRNKSIQIQILDNGEIWVDNRAVDVRAVRANVERMSAVNPEAGVLILAAGQRADRHSRGGGRPGASRRHLQHHVHARRSEPQRKRLNHAITSAHAETGRHGIDLAPMLDFCVNLLIFFIITTSFIKEAGVTVFKPGADDRAARRLGQLADRDPRERRHLDGPAARRPARHPVANGAPAHRAARRHRGDHRRQGVESGHCREGHGRGPLGRRQVSVDRGRSERGRRGLSDSEEVTMLRIPIAVASRRWF